jgi:type 1 glutamine amidotransferase
LWKHGTAVNPTRAVDTTTGAYLDAAKVSLRQYMRAGGGFVAIHNAFGTEYNWPYYEGLLGNANYYDHGSFQNGTINIVAKSDSSTDGLPQTIPFKDEWYNLVPYPTNVKFLATVDENSLATKRTTHPGHGDFHPVAWCQYYDGGRAWLTTLGHDAQAFTDGSGFPGQAQFKQLIVNGILSAMGNKPFCQ